MPLIEMTGLVKKFGSVVALNGLDLRVEGGISGLIGPNGAGKTTTIGVILGLLRADQGSIKVFGLDPWVDGCKVRSKMGVLHEKPYFPKEMSGRKFLKYVASFYKVGEPEGEAHRFLKLMGLEECADRSIGGYSAGMVQRLGIAQALIGHPEFVILDEPTANLDPVGRMELLELISSIARNGDVSFLISTHILSELEKVCRRVSIINRGKIVVEGAVVELMEKFKIDEFTIRTTETDKVLKLLMGLSSVREATVDESRDVIVVRVHDPRAFQEEVFSKASEHQIYNISINPIYGVLEQIYRKAIPSNYGEARVGEL